MLREMEAVAEELFLAENEEEEDVLLRRSRGKMASVTERENEERSVYFDQETVLMQSKCDSGTEKNNKADNFKMHDSLGNGDSIVFEKQSEFPSESGTLNFVDLKLVSESYSCSSEELTERDVSAASSEFPSESGTQNFPNLKLQSDVYSKPPSEELTAKDIITTSNAVIVDEVHEFATRSEVPEYDLEQILEEQETHDLFCPNCKSCITRRVILKKRKRRVAEAVKYDFKQERREEIRHEIREEDSSAPEILLDGPDLEREPALFRCLSCFSFFIPREDGCFSIFQAFGRGEDSRSSVDTQKIPARNLSWIAFIEQFWGKKKQIISGTKLESTICISSEGQYTHLSLEDQAVSSVRHQEQVKNTQQELPVSYISEDHKKFLAQEVTGGSIFLVPPSIEPVETVNLPDLPKHFADLEKHLAHKNQLKIGELFSEGSKYSDYKDEVLIKTEAGHGKSTFYVTEQTDSVYKSDVETVVGKKIDGTENKYSENLAATDFPENEIIQILEKINTNIIIGDAVKKADAEKHAVTDAEKITVTDLLPKDEIIQVLEQTNTAIIIGDAVKKADAEKHIATDLFPKNETIQILEQRNTEFFVGDALKKTDAEGGGISFQPKDILGVKVYDGHQGIFIESQTVGDVDQDIEIQIPLLDQTAPAGERPGTRRRQLEILKSVVYGGLIESITSLGVVSSAAGSNTSTLNVVAIGFANLVAGLFLLINDIVGLRNEGNRVEDEEEDGEEIFGVGGMGDRYRDLLGRKSDFRVHFSIALISYIFTGLLPPLLYGFSFRESDNKEYKLISVAASSLLCIALLAAGKAHVHPEKNYVAALFHHLALGVSASGLAYVAGMMADRLLKQLGLFVDGGGVTPVSPPPPGGFRDGLGVLELTPL